MNLDDAPPSRGVLVMAFVDGWRDAKVGFPRGERSLPFYKRDYDKGYDAAMDSALDDPFAYLDAHS